MLLLQQAVELAKIIPPFVTLAGLFVNPTQAEVQKCVAPCTAGCVAVPRRGRA